MELIHSKDIFYLIRDILKCVDPRVMDHGSRVSYILYRMLQCKDKYEMYEIAEFAMLATLHDIGAYKTEDLSDQLRYESKDYMPHSVYGYLFLLYLTPMGDRSKVILYHHTEYSQIMSMKYDYKDIVTYLNVAEKMDIYSNILGDKFDCMMFQKQAGTKLSPSALELVYQADKKYDMFARISSGEYEKDLEELYNYLIFTNEEKKKYLEGLMYCAGFRSEYTVVDMVTCVCICKGIGEKLLLSKEEMDVLYYGALLHDVGMLAVPREIIEAPRKLTDDEIKILRTHVEIAEKVLKGRIDDDVLEIILTHHERGDGSGYPKRMRDQQMNRLQRIVQVADTITALTNKRSYHDPKPKQQVISILREEADKEKFNKEIVRTFITFYDTIMDEAHTQSEEVLATYRKLQANYELTYKQIKKE